MKETKVYVDELPVNCDKCKYYTQFDNGMGCMITQELRPMDKKENYIQPDCPLVDIKAHDQELVKEVCKKIREYLRTQVIYCGGQATELDIMIASARNQVLEDVRQFLDQIQKEFEAEER